MRTIGVLKGTGGGISLTTWLTKGKKIQLQGTVKLDPTQLPKKRKREGEVLLCKNQLPQLLIVLKDNPQ